VGNWSRPAGVMACSAVATAAGLLYLGFIPWSEPTRTAFLAVLFAASAATVLDPRQPTQKGETSMSLSFAADLIALLLFGHAAMVVVATVGAATRAFADVPRLPPPVRIALDIATALLAALAAGLTYSLLGGTTVPLRWPIQVLPLAAAVVVYCGVTRICADVLIPRATGATIAGRWRQTLLAGCPGHVVGAALTVWVAAVTGAKAFGSKYGWPSPCPPGIATVERI